MDIIRLAESKLVYEESGQQLEEKQDILYSGQIVRIKFKKSQRFLFSTHFINSNKQNNKNKNNQVEQMIFSNDQEEFQDNQFTIYKLDSDKKFEEKFKNIGKGMNEQLIYSGDEVVIMHNQTNSYLFQSNPNEAQKTKYLNELVATKFPKNENSTIFQQLYRFVFVLVDVNGNKCIELNNEIVIFGKFYNQVIYSTEQIVNQEQKHYEVGCRIYDNFNEGDIILLQDAENSFDFKKVKVDQNIKDNQVLVIKHSSSGCVLAFSGANCCQISV
ncbi:MIR motif [Pseudocohnilembus persalinus]|uniref:MIR motif n=1 Tax=Pseudocohnilembus persalinus TaxID=266149 RepID=A0A0V0QEK7_PSEPJ|nr:MIR motif [Pseudocohnilembus persalinus]|eukprot:KRX00595.1 MIR motif [Pseudocohnilembus persalinus]